jgi:hypothetical protein
MSLAPAITGGLMQTINVVDVKKRTLRIFNSYFMLINSEGMTKGYEGFTCGYFTKVSV